MRIIYILLLCVALFMTGCKKNEAQDQTASQSTPHKANVSKAQDHGDMLVVMSIGEPLNLIPAIAQDSASHEVADLIYNGLIAVGKDMDVIGDLAESWDFSNDNKTITFHLRKDVRWQDGVSFTADDVLFTYRFLLDNNTPTPYDTDFRLISDIHAPDNYTVVVTYDEVNARALSSWGMWIMPKHLLDGQIATQSPLQRNPVGTGPYMFESWTANQNLVLRANPDYYKGEPNITKINFRYFQDQGAAFLELLKGGVDFMQLTAAQAAKQTDTHYFESQYNIYSYLSNSYSYIGYNLKRKPFDDKRVRQALSYATPQNQIIETVLHGMGVPAYGPYKPGTIWNNPNLKGYEYNLEKAEALLKEAGFTRNAKGVMEKNGKPFKIELITNQNTTRSEIAEIIQNSWGKLGIEVNIRVLEWGTFISEHIQKSNFDATILAWNIIIDPDSIGVWHSTSCDNNRTLNFVCYQNPVVDKLLEDGKKIIDPELRKAYYYKFQEILADEQPYTFLFVPYAPNAVSKRVKGIVPGAAGITYNIDEWYVPENEQKYKVQ